MRYTSITPEEAQEMLRVIGAERVEALFETIPEGVRLNRPLDLPEAASESELLAYFQALGKKNTSAGDHEFFLGAGSYNHFIPTVIDSIVSRSEFYTCYTPYQPEISQGTLQATFEFQTLICQLTGMEVANASLYDGSSALAEAILMAARCTGRRKILIAGSIHPHYRSVVDTYTSKLDISIEDIPFTESGQIQLDALEESLTEECAGVVLQSPNFFGVLDGVEETSRLCQARGALSIVLVTEAISLGLLKPPGHLGADIVVGEGQSLGLPMGFGGPYLGLFATRDRFKRQLPGRLVGQTVDANGDRGFVLTLATREQHIRRQKATSNICTNQGLCALMAAVFLCTLGKQGIRQMALQNLRKAHYLKQLLGDSLAFSGPIFNEMTVNCGEDPREINRRLLQEGVVGGLPLGTYFPDRSHQMLLCVTEQNSLEKIRLLGDVFKEVGVAS